MSLVPQMTSTGMVIRDSSAGVTWGSFTIKPNISAFRLASADLAENLWAILYPISIGICVVRLTPAGSRLPPFRIRARTLSGCLMANSMAMFAPSEKPKIAALESRCSCIKSYKSRENCRMVKGALPRGDLPWPLVSKAITRYFR